MNRTENREPRGRTLTTADLAAAGKQPADAAEANADTERNERQIERAEERSAREQGSRPPRDTEALEPLFPPEMAEQFRSRWAAVQSSFVDDPRRAAAKGDELVAEVMKNLAETARSAIEPIG
jgi:hypothetical protein